MRCRLLRCGGAEHGLVDVRLVVHEGAPPQEVLGARPVVGDLGTRTVERGHLIVCQPVGMGNRSNRAAPALRSSLGSAYGIHRRNTPPGRSLVLPSVRNSLVYRTTDPALSMGGAGSTAMRS